MVPSSIFSTFCYWLEPFDSITNHLLYNISIYCILTHYSYKPVIDWESILIITQQWSCTTSTSGILMS